VLAGALARAFLTTSEDTRSLEREAAGLDGTLLELNGKSAAAREEVESLESQLERAREEAEEAGAAVQALQSSDPRLAGDPEQAIRDAQAEFEAAAAEREKAAQLREAAPREKEAKRKVVTQREKPTGPKRPVTVAVPKRSKSSEEEDKLSGQHIEGYRSAVVTVLSSARQVGTGLVIGARGRTRYVVTVTDAVPRGADAACLFRIGGWGSDGSFMAAEAEAIHRDDRTRLVLLECTAKALPETGVIGLPSRKPAEAAKGDRVFAVGTQVIGEAAFADNLLEGTVSAVDRSAGDLRVLQVSIPANPGSLGAPVLNGRGGLIGILWAAPGGLERTSLALPASQLGPLLRMVGDSGAAPALSIAEFGGDAVVSVPSGEAPRYREEDAFDLPRPCDDSLEVLAGPADLIVLWDKNELRLSAHKRGGRSPVWAKVYREQNLSLAHQPWAPRALLSRGLTAGGGLDIDLKTGRAGAALPALSSVAGLPAKSGGPWASFPLGDFRVFALERGMAIADLPRAKLLSVDSSILLMARQENLYTFSTLDGKLGWFTQNTFLPILARLTRVIDAYDRELDSDPNRDGRLARLRKLLDEIQAYAGELKTGVSIFEVPDLGRDTLRPRTSFSHVPGTFVHIVGRALWQIGPDRVIKIGKLEPILHGAKYEPWFADYYRESAQPCAMASPDGQYAVTDTHVFDLKEMKPLTELPFPAGPVGFTSSGSFIYANDRVHNRIVFLGVEELLRKRNAPGGSKGG
jgi:S1-C subfamily serine protease